MNLNEAYQFLNFMVNKEQGSWYPPEQLDLIVDRAQMSLFNDYYLEFSKSQRLKDALSPFKTSVIFSNVTSPGGLLTLQSTYMHLLSLYTIITNPVTNLPQRCSVPILNYDELTARLNSQINPPTLSDPVAIQKTAFTFQLYPSVPQAGEYIYLIKPSAPIFGYSIISGRVIVYNPLTSLQLQWKDNDIVSILVKALSFLGINMSEQDVLQYAEQKDQLNIMSPKDKL